MRTDNGFFPYNLDVMLVSPAKENTEAVRTLSRYDDNNRKSSQCTVADVQVNKIIKKNDCTNEKSV